MLTHPELEIDDIGKRMETRLKQLGLFLDETLNNIMKESLKGLETIIPYITEAYGFLDIIGKGESRYLATPCYGIPDYVAMSSLKKPVLIEVKNTKSKSKKDVFQTEYYNTLESTVGVIIYEEREEQSEKIIAPKTVFSQNSETLIVYPRLGEYVEITDTIDLSVDLIKEVWQAKQLGFRGKWPYTYYGVSCPHKRFGINLSEDDMEVLKPPPLIFSKGMEEKDVDLDYVYLRRYVRTQSQDMMSLLRSLKFHTEIHKNLNLESITQQLREMLVNSFGFDLQDAKKLLLGRTTRVESSELCRDMGDEIEPWEKILADKTMTVPMGLGTRMYSLPKKSHHSIKMSWDKWK
jgi:hypothetical protein